MPMDEDCPVYKFSDNPPQWASLFWSWSKWCDELDVPCTDICEGGEPGVLRRPVGDGGYCDCTIDRTVDQKCCADGTYSQPTQAVWMPMDEDCPSYEYEQNYWASLFWSWSKWCDELDVPCTEICEGEIGILFRPIGDGGYCDCTVNRAVDQKCCVDNIIIPTWSAETRVWVPVDEDCPHYRASEINWLGLVRGNPEHCDAYTPCADICSGGPAIVVGPSIITGYCDCSISISINEPTIQKL